MSVSFVGRTSWSAADVLVGLLSVVLQTEQAGRGRRPYSGKLSGVGRYLPTSANRDVVNT